MAGEIKMTLLRKLLTNRHLESHRAFRLEYDKTARKLDRNLIATAPGREQYARWLAGRVKTKPSADHCRVLEHMFPGYHVAELLAPYDPEAGVPRPIEIPSDDQETPTNRRQIFQLGAVTMTTGLIETVTNGPDLLEQVLDSTSVGDAKLSLLESEVENLSMRVAHVPPATLLPHTLLTISTVRELLKNRQPTKTQRRLVRVSAKLAIVMGEILFSANQPTLARRWWATAMRAADEAGDRYLMDIALAHSVYPAVYSDSPHEVLDQLQPRLEQASKATPAVAWMWGFAALAHATLGTREDFERAINASRDMLTRCEPGALKPGIFSFLPRKQAFFEARGRADLGDSKGAGDSATRALAGFELTSKTDPALVRFAYASALAKAGETEAACQLATKAINAVHDLGINPALAVVVRAHDFNTLIDPKADVAQEWRETLANISILELSQTTPSTVSRRDHYT